MNEATGRPGIAFAEVALRRDAVTVAVGLGLVVVAAWAWTLAGMDMRADDGQGMTMAETMVAAASWSPGHAALIFAMWWVMMVAMMLPSAAPLILLATAIHRRKGEAGQPEAVAGLLGLGYLAVWGMFSVAATLAQWGLEAVGLISQHMAAAVPVVAGGLLLAAGLYQLTPLKQACLRYCRAPVAFLTAHWRPGATGGFRMGVIHGAYCVGCCWFLMALLFAGGVMNPLWIGGIALYVLVEKFVPRGERISQAIGLVLVVLGGLTLLGAI